MIDAIMSCTLEGAGDDGVGSGDGLGSTAGVGGGELSPPKREETWNPEGSGAAAGGGAMVSVLMV